MKIKSTIFIALTLLLLGLNVSAQNWNQIIKSCASDREAGDNFGYSVAVNGNFAIVGAYLEGHAADGTTFLSKAGSAYIFEFNGTSWTQIQKIVAPDRNVDDYFGASVAISGDYIVVGAHQEDENASGMATMSNTGSAYIYKNNSGTWTFQQKIVASDRFTEDFFGQSVAIDGEYVIVGAWSEDEDIADSFTMLQAGSAYIFKNNSGTWTQTQKIVASDRAAADYFGWSVALSGNYAIIGAYAEDENALGSGTQLEAGSVYIFLNTLGTFAQVQKIVPTDRAVGDFFGYSVDIDGDYLIAGAYNEDEDASGGTSLLDPGSAYIFKNNAGTWTQLNKLVNSDRQNYDQFGLSVSISGSFAVVGANGEDHDINGGGTTLNFAGSSYIYKNNSDTWSQVQKICASDRANSDNFGFAVGISGNHIIVSANSEDHDAAGLPASNMLSAGSVYFFRNSPEINVKQNVTNIANGGTYNFGDVLYGNSSSAISFTIENTGGGDLNLTGTPKIDKSTGDVGAFTINQASVSSSVAPAGSTSFTVTYTPSAAGAHTTNLVIANDDSDENPYTIVLQGTGTKQDQTISGFASITTRTYGDVAFTVSATASSGLGVVFTSSNTSVATCTGTNGTTVTIVGAGDCQIRANQNGNAYYNAAPQVFQNLTVNAKTINVTADPKSKIYGDVDPTLTYTFTPTLVGSDSFSGALTRTSGECGNCYAQIEQGTLTLGDNYTINYTPDDLFIAKRPLTVTVNPNQAKVYGSANPTPYTYSYTGTLAYSQTFTGTLTRTAGETVGLYPITQGTLTVNANYAITFEGDDFEITAKPITVTANSSQTKIYGQANPGAYSYTVTGTLISGDNFTGALARESGEDVGPYEIQQGTLALSSNYNITYVPANFQITAKNITVVANSMQNKYYGDADPTYTYWLMGVLESGDSFSGALSRAAGEDVGNYAITIGTLSAGSNYNLGFTTAQFQVKVKPITITVTAGQTKVYGQSDPVFAYTTNVGIASWDSFTGALTRTAGESVGSYPITQGTLALNSNYNITYSGSNFGITAKSLTVTAEAGQTKVYGESDPPAYTYTLTGSLETGDNITGALVRDFGENIGIYEIKQGSLSAGSNYLIMYEEDYFEITVRSISLIVDANQTKIYGNSDPMFTFSFSDELVSGDSYSGVLTREPGQNVGIYVISQGSLVLPNNYDVTFVPADFEILTRDITITADADQSRLYGETDPELNFSTSTSIASWDNFTGELTREAGEDVGIYAITQGSLALNSNYYISYVGDDFEITTRPITVVVNTGQTKVFGEADPSSFAYSLIGTIVGDDSFSGALIREAGENAGLYVIEQGDLALTSNYNLEFTLATFEILKATPEISWENPADIYDNEALSVTQLNATASVDGSFIYNPNFETFLEVGDNQPLSCSFTPTDETNYNSAEKTVYINVLLWVGLEEKSNNELSVYPNPTNGILQINLTEGTSAIITVFDLSGKLLTKINDCSGKIDLSNFPEGMYIIKIQSENTNKISNIIIQK